MFQVSSPFESFSHQVRFYPCLTLDPDIRFPIEDHCVLVGELDGVRIISSTTQELLQEVPLVCQDIFKIASMAPGALLLEAHREYEVGTCLYKHLSSLLNPVGLINHPSVCLLSNWLITVLVLM